MGVDGNEMAYQLARQGSLCPFIGREPAVVISAKIAREVIRGWRNRKYIEYWQSVCGQRQVKGFLKTPSAKRAGQLLSLNRNQLRILTRLLIGHCYLKGHLFKFWLVNSPASQILYHCKALAALRFRCLGHCFMKPGPLRISLLAGYCTLLNVQSC
jgi:hypothetical protein